jgi:phosphoenolpyruvate carboxykinase (ATP)
VCINCRITSSEIGVSCVLGSDYYGESKKGHLRMAMWNAKQQGMLGLHAGSKLLRARDPQGRILTYGMVIFGLTATGKTTHACHHHGLTAPGEGIAIVQDDVIFLRPDGATLGSERGFYIKTEGLSPTTQLLLYRAATSPDAIYENVMVGYEGKVDFSDETLTGNGRCIIQKRDLGEAASDGYDTPPAAALDGLVVAFIVRRNTVVPIASRLTHEQAAAAFMLGESIESSGSDPRRAGESVREVGTNPFIIGDKADEGNRFHAFLQCNAERVRCYLLNTGGVGEIATRQPDGTRQVQQRVTRVEIPEMAAIIRGIARGTIAWEREPHFGTEVPVSVEGVEMERFRLDRFYNATQVEELVRGLKRERVEYMRQFTGLHSAIVEAVAR